MVRKGIVHIKAHESFYNVIEGFRREFEKKTNTSISSIRATELMAKTMAIPKVTFRLGGQIERKKRRCF